MSETISTSTELTRCTIAGATAGSPLARVAVGMWAPAELRRQVLARLEPFVLAEEDHPAQLGWHVVATFSARGPGSDAEGLVPYGGHDDTAVWIRVDPLAQRVILVATPESRYLAVHTMRMVRSLLRLAVAEDDPAVLFLHGGMFARAGSGFAVVGGKRSGKTSIVLSMLASGHDFVSNDDLSVHVTGGVPGATGIGWPRSVSVRQDTLSALGAAEVRGRHPANSTFATYRSEAQLLFPAQVAQLYNAELAPSATVAGLLFPRFVDEDSTDTGIVELTRTQAGERLVANVLDPPVKDEFLATHFAVPDNTTVAGLADRLAAELPAFEVRHNLRTTSRTAADLTALLEHHR
jgi:hypothetical protein